jgi:hypothetical protein
MEVWNPKRVGVFRRIHRVSVSLTPCANLRIRERIFRTFFLEESGLLFWLKKDLMHNWGPREKKHCFIWERKNSQRKVVEYDLVCSNLVHLTGT